MYKDIKERTFEFGVRVVKMSEQLPNSKAGKVLGNQVLRSGTSIGANVEEAVAAFSTEDYIFKMNTALKEARETHFWLRLIKASELLKPSRLEAIINEAEEIKKILGAIVSKVKASQKSKIRSKKDIG
ncbi:MAG: four helix bundle protein [Bacteroidetes bacterium]|nr:MAG: four helix bundle protein [Bacteroidota bacterium]